MAGQTSLFELTPNSLENGKARVVSGVLLSGAANIQKDNQQPCVVEVSGRKKVEPKLSGHQVEKVKTAAP